MNTPQHRIAAVWFADISGYTRLSTVDSALAIELVRRFQEEARAAIDSHGGRLIKFIGDGAMSEFPSTDAAVRAALALHAAFAEHSAAAGRPGSLLHSGIHMAEVTTGEEGDIYGDGVNVASRLQEEARPGEILVSEDVWRQLRGRADLRFRPVGERSLKGIPSPVAAYAALPVGAGKTRGVAAHRFSRGRRKNLAYLGFGVLIALATLGLIQRFGLDDGPSRSTSDLPTPPVGSPAADEASIAVLPFVDMSGGDEGYFADGITEDIVAALSRIDGLRVISRTSVMAYKNSDKPIPQIASELGVTTILEGSVRRAGDRVRITAQLIDADSDEHLWTETYDREMTDIFAIQSEIASEIARALEAELSADVDARIAAVRTRNLPAYDLYLRGREALYRAMSFQDMDETRRSNNQAIDLFRQALALDPDYALAWAGLGRAFEVRKIYDGLAWGDSSLAAAQRAVDLDPELPEARVALAHVALQRGQMTIAHRELHRAIELSPNHAEALGALAMVEGEAGRFDEALPWALRAASVEPTNAQYAELVGYTYGTLDDLEEGERWLRKSLAIDPRNASAYGWMTFARLFAGDDAGAARAAQQALSLGPNSPETWWPVVIVSLRQKDYDRARVYLERWASMTDPLYMPHVELGFVYLKLGERAKAEEFLARAESITRERIEAGEEAWWPYWIMVHLSAIRGDEEGAVAWFREAAAHGFRIYRWVEIDPLLENVRDDPRLRDEVRKMKAEVDAMRERAERASAVERSS